MVALHYACEVPDESEAITAARRDVDRLGAGLSRSLLSTPPAIIRELAARAMEASGAAERRADRVGDRPDLDDAAVTQIGEAVSAYKSARAVHAAVLNDRHRLLAMGNACGIGALLAAAGLSKLGLQVMSWPVGFLMTGAATGPLASSLIAAGRCSNTTVLLNAARQKWAAALEASGFSTMGAFGARRIALAAWERGRDEAAASEEAARVQQRAWNLLAGPGVPAIDVEVVLAQVESLRRAHLRLLGALLAELPRPPAPVEALGRPEPVAPDLPPPAAAWLTDAFDRIRGRKLRFH